MTAGAVSLRFADRLATITVDRPEARNAMTLDMYAALLDALAEVRGAKGVRALVFSGNVKAFIAGTDISEFTRFTSGADGLAYEARVEEVVSAVESIPVPTMAVIRGAAAGGGLVIAAACDLRLMSTTARVGVPIARTVGNCLSTRNLQRLERAFGPGPVRQMLFGSEMLDAAQCERAGFATWVVDESEIETQLGDKLGAIVTGAPLTHGATKAALARLAGGDLSDSDIIEQIYGSADFREGVSAFMAKRRPEWKA